MFEKILFNLIAVSIFVIIFFKIIRKNDTNYFIILILQAIGITISFIEIKSGVNSNLFFKVCRYFFAVIIPCLVIYIESKKINFSEILSYSIAKFLLFLKNNKKAKSVLIKLVTKYPESYLGHKLLAKIYEQEGGRRKAIDEYVKLVDIKGNDYDSYFKIADLLNDLDQKDEAIQMLENLLKSKPDSYQGTILIGELLCEQSRFKEAQRYYEDALKYKPNDFDLYYNLGIVYTMMSDFQMAKEMYEMAAQINHLAYGANYNLGQIALIQGDLNVAEKYFKNSIYDDLEAKAYYQLAKIYTLKGEKDIAILFLNKAIEINFNLLEKANKEEIFKNIRQYITVSVKMEKESEDEEEIDKEDTENNKKKRMKLIEEKSREYLESADLLVRNMNEITEKEKINKKVEEIFKKNELLQNEKNEQQKELGSN